jgi:hypothetical protein
MMPTSTSYKQIDDLQAGALHDSFNIMEQMRIQVERITRNLMTLEPDQPDDIQRLLNEWRLLLQRETEQFRERVEEGFQHARSFMAGPGDNVADNPESNSQNEAK